MERISTCRVCLTTEGKLFEMFKYRLVGPYEMISGETVKQDSLPVHLCSYCSVSLIKSASFMKKCRKSLDLLKYTFLNGNVVTTDIFQNIEKQHTLSFSITITNTYPSDEPITIKVETQDVDQKLSIETESDEEPLSEISKKNFILKKEEHNINENDDYNVDFNEESDSEKTVKDTSGLKGFNDIDMIVLSKEEQMEEIEARKNSLNYLNSHYKCDQCFKGFITESTYKNHMIRHDPRSGPHMCQVCHSRWASRAALRVHGAAHRARFRCRRCGHVARSKHSAKEHSNWHEGHTFRCDTCGANFNKSTSLLTHVRARHSSLRCACGAACVGRYGLALHVARSHQNGTTTELRCDRCSVTFRDEPALTRHIELTEGACSSDLRPCTRCGVSCDDEVSLKEHLKLHQKEDAVKCEDCGRTFAHARSYSAHRARAHAGRPGPGRGPARRLVCELCGLTCPSNATLTYHQRTHTGEKPHQCPLCPKTFSVQQRLKIHIRTHTGERPFKCAHCPKAFKHKAALNRHDRVHTGAKPYTCPQCGKSFSQSNSLKTHARAVHLKLPAPRRDAK